MSNVVWYLVLSSGIFLQTFNPIGHTCVVWLFFCHFGPNFCDIFKKEKHEQFTAIYWQQNKTNFIYHLIYYIYNLMPCIFKSVFNLIHPVCPNVYIYYFYKLIFACWRTVSFYWGVKSSWIETFIDFYSEECLTPRIWMVNRPA